MTDITFNKSILVLDDGRQQLHNPPLQRSVLDSLTHRLRPSVQVQVVHVLHDKFLEDVEHRFVLNEQVPQVLHDVELIFEQVLVVLLEVEPGPSPDGCQQV